MSKDLVDAPRPMPQSLMHILAEAIDRGVDPDRLGKLMDLVEREQSTRAVQAFNVAMHAAQSEMPRVLEGKQGRNNKYAPLEVIQDVLKPITNAHGLSISWSEGPMPQPGWMTIIARIRHIDGHHEDHTAHFPHDGTGPKGGSGSMNAVQGVGSSHSYARRYMLCDLFNITLAGEDTDGNGPTPTETLIAEEVGEIEKLLADPIQNRERFLTFMQSPSVEKILRRDFERAIGTLKQKKAKAAK